MRLCYFVLGMHRSGTSTMAGILNILGVNAGLHLLEPHESNQKGFFENAAIVAFNERLLHYLGAEWFDILMIPENWWLDELMIPYYSELQKIIETEFNDSKEILIRNSRICVLLPFYLSLFSKISVSCRFVIIFRNPVDVSASLEYRDNLNIEHAQLLWIDHVIKSKSYTKGLPRIFIWYPELVGDPIRISRILINNLNLNGMSVETEQKILDFVDPHLMHFRSRTVKTEIPEINIVYNTLLKMRNGAESNSYQKIIEQAGMSFRKSYGLNQGIGIKPEARLIMKTYAGSKTAAIKPVNYGRNLMEYDLTHCNNIVSMIFNPCNMPVCFKINNITAIETSGTEPVILNWNADAEINEQGIIVFDTEVKEMNIQPMGLNGSRILLIDMTYFGFGMAACRVQRKTSSARMIQFEKKILEDENLIINMQAMIREHQKESQEMVLKLEDRIIDLEARIRKNLNENEKLNWQVRALQSSYTWKTGSLLLFPIRYIHSIISKII